jgi:3-oxoacyl-[acyl-carrier-protein] synthase I
MSASPSIVITGAGAVCAAGRTIESIWEAVREGRSSIGPITQWDASRWPVGVAAEIVNVDNRTLVEDRKLHKMISRTDLVGLYAAGVAVQQSGLIAHRESLEAAAAVLFNDRTGVFAGSGGGTYRSHYDFFPLMAAAKGDLEVFGREVGASVNPMWLLRNLPNNVLCHVGIRFGFKGTNACVTNQCTGGLTAVAEAAAAVRAGEADRAVAVGHDTPIEPETLLYYHRLGLLASDTLRPFDAERAGTVFGEGAAAVVIETAAGAHTRQAAVLGEFLGSGCVTEGTGILSVRPDGDGVSRAIDLALADSGVSPGEVGMIVAHGNGTRASDASEAMAFRRVFGQAIPPVTGFKWAYGHSISASGVLDLALGLHALRQRVVPGVATLRQLDPDLAPLPVSPLPQEPRSDVGLVVCRGFGGMNVALVFRAT